MMVRPSPRAWSGMTTTVTTEIPMNSDVQRSNRTGEIPSLEDWDNGELPLVLITVGGGIEEFAALYDHLEMISSDSVPKVQSLIVARPGTPKAIYQGLRARTKEMSNVHIRRLGDDVEDCVKFAHETGTFYATRPKSEGGS